MVDALEAVLTYLRSEADVNLLTGGQIAAKHKFGDGWIIPSKAVQVRYDGGVADLYTPRQLPRLEVRCYGESQSEAAKVYGAVVAASRTMERKRVDVDEGQGLIYWFNLTSGPSALMEPDADVDFILVFAEAAVSEVEIA